MRNLGELKTPPGILIKGPKGVILSDKDVIVAMRDIHVPPAFAIQHGFLDKELVSIQFAEDHEPRMKNVLIRITDKCVTEIH